MSNSTPDIKLDASSTTQSTGKRLYIQIAERLAELINTGEIAALSRLPAERELAARFDVSRQTIREALIALEVSKLVEIKPGSGVYALAIGSNYRPVIIEDAPGPLEIMESRKLVEGEAASLAAERISNDEIVKLKILLKQMQQYVDHQQSAQAERVDRQFHLVIAQATRNSALVSIIEWLWELRDSSEISRVFAKKVRDLGTQPNIEAHTQIYQCLSRRDAIGAKQAMQDHLNQVADVFIHLLDSE